MPVSSLRRAMLIFLRPCTVPKQWQHVLKIVQNARFVQKFLSALPLRPKAELQRARRGESWDVPAKDSAKLPKPGPQKLVFSIWTLHASTSSKEMMELATSSSS